MTVTAMTGQNEIFAFGLTCSIEKRLLLAWSVHNSRYDSVEVINVLLLQDTYP